MIKLFVNRPATTIIFVSFFVVLGLVSYFNLNIESYPKVEFPIVTIEVVYPGATPVEVETLVVKKIEDAISELSEIKKLQSFSYENFCYIFLQFNLGVNVNVKSIEVKDKVEAILNDLPSNIEKPIIQKFDPLIEPVLELVLSSKKADEVRLYEFADKKLKTKLASIPGVANLDIYGGKKRQININLDPWLMKKYYLAIDEVLSSIAMRNLNIPSGTIDKKDSSINVRLLGEFQNLDEISELELSNSDGAKFRLKDVATIEDSFKKIETIARFNGESVVGISIKKVSDGNAVSISKDIYNELPNLRKFIPEDMKLEVATDTTTFIINETTGTFFNILLGIILTVIILFVFIGKFKPTIIASIVLPTSVVSCLFLMDKFDFTINVMTLLAIATALGTLIANAIVIIESVVAHIEKGKDPKQAAIEGTQEVTVAILASAGTNLVVFTPIAFMGGIVGQFMKAFGLTVVFATIFSLIASFSLTPMLCGILLKYRKKEEKHKKRASFKDAVSTLSGRAINFMLKEYRKIFDLMFRVPKTTIVLIVIALFSSFSLAKYIGNEVSPTDDENKITIKISTPQGSTIDKTLAVTRDVEKIVKKIPEVISYLTFIGDNGVENSKITANLIKSQERERSDLDIINFLIPKLARIPDAEIDLLRSDFAGAGEGDISINVYGTDYEEMIAISKNMMKIMKKSDYFRSVTSSYKTPKKEIRFIPDQEKMVFYGESNAKIGTVLRASIYGDDSNVYKEKGEEYKINVTLADQYKNSIKDINQINIISSKGLMPVTELGDLVESKSLPTIRRRDRDRVIRLEGFLSKSTAGHVQGELDKMFSKMSFNSGYGYNYVGNAEIQSESNEEIMKAFILAIILTYMILCAILNSFVHPFTIATSIGCSLLGVIFGLFFLGYSFNIASMLAIVMLVGLVVNNAILLIDYTQQKVNSGVPIIDALWQGVEARFRVILMTSIAVVFGVLPQLRSLMQIKASMGAVIIGGMLASIIFTFILIPIVYWYLERMRARASGKKGNR